MTGRKLRKPVPGNLTKQTLLKNDVTSVARGPQLNLSFLRVDIKIMYSLLEPLRPASHDDVQCAATLKNGKQCHFAAEDGQIYCRRHRELTPVRRFEYATAMQMPHIPKGQLFDLTAEVRLLKQLIASRVEQLRDADGVLLYSGHIADLMTRLQKLIDGALKLELARGELLPKAAALDLIKDIMDIVADVVIDQSLLDLIQEKIEERLVP